MSSKSNVGTKLSWYFFVESIRTLIETDYLFFFIQFFFFLDRLSKRCFRQEEVHSSLQRVLSTRQSRKVQCRTVQIVRHRSFGQNRFSRVSRGHFCVIKHRLEKEIAIGIRFVRHKRQWPH